ncbi:RecX family transcriptional regulator [Sphingomonas sp. RP10(2022)]|uniref:RecX family transcriptional regulator n=1 Tax=Sphingomonas liriopis TaxID=2949094 RepID=A0A9X2KPN5_9SPHN|nr:RecX family transcriptional regulator [Sphingomonas liriopis]MCP3734874.1 RecX family transcriptional regulator [Sphingomonas liriopis]
MAMRPERRPPPPLDAAALERLALRYVERFATTRGKLADYLTRKIRERGWEGAPADPHGLAERMAELGYVDDRSYAEAKAAALTRRGFGARRVAMALQQARVASADSAEVTPAIRERAGEAALIFARRKRIGPFGPPVQDRAVRDRQLAAMLRAGHGMDLSRRIVMAREPGELDEIE